MNDIELRVSCLKAASKLAGSASELLRLSFAFECYAAAGYNCGASALEFGPHAFQPAQPPQSVSEPEPAPAPQSTAERMEANMDAYLQEMERRTAARTTGVWLDPLPGALVN